jgi:hypothetical protein
VETQGTAIDIAQFAIYPTQLLLGLVEGLAILRLASLVADQSSSNSPNPNVRYGYWMANTIGVNAHRVARRKLAERAMTAATTGE